MQPPTWRSEETAEISPKTTRVITWQGVSRRDHSTRVNNLHKVISTISDMATLGSIYNVILGIPPLFLCRPTGEPQAAGHSRSQIPQETHTPPAGRRGLLDKAYLALSALGRIGGMSEKAPEWSPPIKNPISVVAEFELRQWVNRLLAIQKGSEDAPIEAAHCLKNREDSRCAPYPARLTCRPFEQGARFDGIGSGMSQSQFLVILVR